jgi:hypothetical protein
MRFSRIMNGALARLLLSLALCVPPAFGAAPDNDALETKGSLVTARNWNRESLAALPHTDVTETRGVDANRQVAAAD